ncbi:hypothetical protein QTN24_08600 [Cupriavidus sp. SZY C1]|uniref:hypothetical protein n=1 Tax=Cupriavidus sp. SZY C1 TaxID=3055037 RepID=UPI0028B489A5|nr:hypothetical protein [Cupriavidus sp. SZY C1]MDT6961557.1 hypothetical protein [Cupriavidus sp. SZY C1]
MKTFRVLFTACALALPAALTAAPHAAHPAQPSARTAAPAAPAYDPVRYRSCTVYAATALSAAVDMRTHGYSAKRALFEGGNPPSAPMVALTEFAASAIQARPAGGRDAASTLSGFLAGVCYQRNELPTLQ